MAKLQDAIIEITEFIYQLEDKHPEVYKMMLAGADKDRLESAMKTAEGHVIHGDGEDDKMNKIVKHVSEMKNIVDKMENTVKG